MANDEFKTMLIEDVVFKYPKLDKPYTFDPRQNKSIPVEPRAKNAAWSTGFEISVARASELKKELVAHYEACRVSNPELPEFSTVFGAKVSEDGQTVTFTAKRNCINAKGVEVAPPPVVDAKLKAIEDRVLWSGSEGSVSLIAFPAKDPQTHEGGISLLLRAVQVVELVRGSDVDDFSVKETKEEKESKGSGEFVSRSSKSDVADLF